MFTTAKRVEKRCIGHYLYFLAVSEACGVASNLVLDSIVHYGDLEMPVTMLSRLNVARTEYLRQGTELARFSQSTENNLKGKQLAKDLINVAHPKRKAPRKCLNCGKIGHVKAGCPETNGDRSKRSDADFVLAVKNKNIGQGYCILDSG